MSLMYCYPCTPPVYQGILINELSLFIKKTYIYIYINKPKNNNPEDRMKDLYVKKENDERPSINFIK